MTLQSPLGASEIKNRLTERLVGRVGLVNAVFRGADFMSDPKAERPENIKFSGVVSDRRFELTRWVPYRNSFTPKILGQLRADAGGGTRIDISMRLHRIVTIFSWVWILGTTLIGVAWLWPSLMWPRLIEHGELIPIGMAVFWLALLVIGTRVETRKAALGLQRVLNAEVKTDRAAVAP